MTARPGLGTGAPEDREVVVEDELEPWLPPDPLEEELVVELDVVVEEDEELVDVHVSWEETTPGISEDAAVPAGTL